MAHAHLECSCFSFCILPKAAACRTCRPVLVVFPIEFADGILDRRLCTSLY
jgi:hypothetical protein